jgi:hypothetical protein
MMPAQSDIPVMLHAEIETIHCTHHSFIAMRVGEVCWM